MAYAYHMRLGIFYHVFMLFAWGCASAHAAQTIATQPLLEQGQKAADTRNSLLVLDLGTGEAGAKRMAAVIVQAKLDMPKLQWMQLASEQEILPTLEQKVEEGIDMVIMIAPKHQEIIAQVPGLYPDIKFTFIDAPQSIYANNVQNVQFKRDEGAFLLGAIAGVRGSQKIMLMTKDENPATREVFTYFTRGVHHANPQAKIEEHLITNDEMLHKRLSGLLSEAFQNGTDIMFSADHDITEQALRSAKPERRLVIYDDAPDKTMETERMLTYMVKRHDLALLDVVQLYKHRQWRSGIITLGVGGGYVDYSLTQENVEIFPKEYIDKIEAIKDYISQGFLMRDEGAVKRAI